MFVWVRSLLIFMIWVTKQFVVVDILRATSCMTTAFAHGVAAIKPVAIWKNAATCRQRLHHLRRTQWEKVDSFDKGNSPFEYMGADIKEGKLPSPQQTARRPLKAKHAKSFWLALFELGIGGESFESFHQFSCYYLCWLERPREYETLFCRAVVDALKSDFEITDDAELMAHQLYQEAKSNMVRFLSASSHVKRLNRLNIHKDIEFCLTPNQYNVLPKLANGELVQFWTTWKHRHMGFTPVYRQAGWKTTRAFLCFYVPMWFKK